MDPVGRLLLEILDATKIWRNHPHCEEPIFQNLLKRRQYIHLQHFKSCLVVLLGFQVAHLPPLPHFLVVLFHLPRHDLFCPRQERTNGDPQVLMPQNQMALGRRRNKTPGAFGRKIKGTVKWSSCKWFWDMFVTSTQHKKKVLNLLWELQILKCLGCSA